MEPISLTLNSPRVPLVGLDEAILKLERVDMLLDKLARPGLIRIGFRVEGTETLDAAHANITALRTALNNLGRGDLAVKMEKGLMGAGEIAGWAKGEVAKLGRELEHATLKSVQMQGKFEEFMSASKGDMLKFATHDKIDALKRELAGAIGEVDTLQAKLAALHHLRGVSEGVSGTPVGSGGPAASSVAASGAMAASAAKQSEAAGEAVKAQREGVNLTRQQIDQHRQLFDLTRQVAQQHQVINAPKLGVERIVQSYRELTAESGKAAVAISDLQKRSGASLEDLQGWIKKQRTAGRASLVQGEWATATDEMRDAAMKAKVGNKIQPHMYVQVSEPGMQKLGGPSQALSEHSKNVAAMAAASKAAEALGTSEAKLVQPANASAAALALQEAIVREKIAAMSSLNGVTQTLAASERKLAEAAGQAGAAQARAGEISRRITTDASGKVARESVTFSEGPGQTRTRTGRGGLTTTNINQLGAWQAAITDTRAEFSAKRSALNDAGFAKGGAEQLDMLKQELGARRAILAEMDKAGLSGERMYKSEGLRLKAMDEAITRGEQLNRGKAQAAQEEAARQTQIAAAKQSELVRRDVRDQLDTGFRERAAHLERELATMKQMKPSRQDEINLLRRQSVEYGNLAQAMEASGRGRTPGALSARQNEQVFAARASQLDTVALDRLAENQRIKALAARYQGEYAAFGGTEKRTSDVQGPTGRVLKQSSQRDDANGMREMIQLTRRWNESGLELTPTLTRTSQAMEATGRSATAAGKSMLDNLGTVAAWSASVAVLYKSLALLTFGVESMKKLEFQSARLSAVFRSTNEELTAQSATIILLRNRTLDLAAANGRGGEEAMDAAIRWSRLGLTHKEVLEAVDVSLKAANVAEISTSEAAEQLAAVFAAYQLQVSELRTVLGELNAISNRYNVTNKDLLNGLARTSAIARQAGLSFSELLGIIASGVGRTGRPGAEIGNAVKSIIVALSNPTIQKALHTQFKFEVKTPRDELKDMSTLLNEIFVMFQKLDKGDQGAFLQKVGGKLQASRLQAIMDGYVTGQMLAIQAQRDLGSAEIENEKIRATTLNQLQALSTAFQHLSVSSLTAFGSMSAGEQFKNLIKLITNVIGLMADWPKVFLIIMGLIAAMGVRIVSIMVQSAGSAGILGRTIGHLRALWLQFAQAVTVGNAALAQHNATARATPVIAPAVVGGGAPVVAPVGLARGLGATFMSAVFSKEMAIFLGLMIALQLAMVGINKLFAYFGTAADEAAEKLGVYNKALEQTKSLVGAAEMAQRIAGTLSKSLPEMYAKNPRAANRAIEDFASVAYTRDEDPGGKKRLALRDELLAIVAIGDMKRAQLRMDQEELRLNEAKRRELAVQLYLKKNQMDEQEKQIVKLKQDISKREKRHGTDDFFVGRDQQKLAEAEKALRELQGEVGRDFTATYDAAEAYITEERKDFRNATKSRMKGVEDVYQAQPTTAADDEVEKVDRRTQMEEDRLQMLKDTAEQIRQNGLEAIAAAKKEAEAMEGPFNRYAALRAARKQYEDEYSKAVVEDRKGSDLTGRRTQSKYQAMLRAKENLEGFDASHASELKGEKQVADLRNKKVEAHASLQGHQDAMLKQIAAEVELQGEALDAEKEKLKEAREYAKLQDAISAGRRLGKNESIQFQTGRSETEQLLSEARGIGSLNAPAPPIETDWRKKGQDYFIKGWGPNETETYDDYIARYHDQQSQTGPVSEENRENNDRQLRKILGPKMVEPAPRDLGSLNGLLGNAVAQRSTAIGAGDKVGRSRAEGEILQLTNRLGEIGVRLEERRYQLARDIVNERRKEAEEASKALLTASREEQLRAALLKRFTQDNGPIGIDQFQFLDKGTQEALQKFTPEAAPKELGSRASELEAEQKTLLLNIQGISEAMKQVGDEIRTNLRLNSAPPPGGAAGGGTAMAAPQIPTPNVNMQFAEQYSQMLQVMKDGVITMLGRQIDEMRSEFQTFKTQFRTADAQRSGAESMAG